ncbi:hypothetical protein [Amycolatopsis keratiniphila]|uniref:hypothetical protein n=1 Tax=Amycolatopsis keratiniphila TaxID=129921 RepID=UPI00087BD426|nr:hypothetical protein [Amycolatopsis keratiniphila]OLZ50264.1 hypothetical protein BS330_28770 [Amycolatopsis keratiniphila subsp. nogabecina]SDU66940.1 hypothetical protein SAMN04489733_8034 [Amycolatopsis keratiniphila]
MRSLTEVLADIDQQLTDAEHIPTSEPTAVAAYLRELLTRHGQWATVGGIVSEVVTADTIRREAAHLTQQ